MPPVCIFLRSGSYELVHQALSLAAAAVATGRQVELFFFWWALERLVGDRLDEPDLERDEINATMELRGLPTLRQLLHVVRDSGLARIHACSGSMAALGLSPQDVEPRVDGLTGWATILQRTSGATERFFF